MPWTANPNALRMQHTADTPIVAVTAELTENEPGLALQIATVPTKLVPAASIQADDCHRVTCQDKEHGSQDDWHDAPDQCL